MVRIVLHGGNRVLSIYKMASWILLCLLFGGGSSYWSYRLGIRHERAAWKADAAKADIAALMAQILRETRANDIANQHRRAVRLAVQDIEIRTEQSFLVVKQAFDSTPADPRCVFPGRVQSELGAAIDRANTAISGLRNRPAGLPAASTGNPG